MSGLQGGLAAPEAQRKSGRSLPPVVLHHQIHDLHRMVAYLPHSYGLDTSVRALEQHREQIRRHTGVPETGSLAKADNALVLAKLVLLEDAANLGRDQIITVLHELGATDLTYAIERAVLQSRIETAGMLHRMLGAPRPPAGSFGGAAYTLSVSGTEFLFSVGAELQDEHGNPDAPVDVVLESDSRNPKAKHAIIELYAAHGFALPDTPMMALHRGRLDLLEEHLRRDPELLRRTFAYEEIFPPELRCHPPAPGSYDEGLPRTPLAGTTLLHVCVEFDELEIARWLLDSGMDADAPAAIDANGFGGHTALFGAVVSYPHFWMNFTGGWASSRKPQQAEFAQLLLDHGADPNARASFRDFVKVDGAQELRDLRDITPLAWGEEFHDKMVVSEPAMRLVAARGGRR